MREISDAWTAVTVRQCHSALRWGWRRQSVKYREPQENSDRRMEGRWKDPMASILHRSETPHTTGYRSELNLRWNFSPVIQRPIPPPTHTHPCATNRATSLQSNAQWMTVVVLHSVRWKATNWHLGLTKTEKSLHIYKIDMDMTFPVCKRVSKLVCYAQSTSMVISRQQKSRLYQHVNRKISEKSNKPENYQLHAYTHTHTHTYTGFRSEY